ncbi:hypothetical protein ACFPA8_07820 [Streptomyces ovatisporus]|uniref:Uncharacterized protein n=1 Tax=Streptomyces ovatisporus TaxID=1128682 RepID=A0ABV9A607_9ACTN
MDINEQFDAVTAGLEDEITEEAIQASVDRTMGHLASEFVLLDRLCDEFIAREWTPEGAETAALSIFNRLMDRLEYGVPSTTEDGEE